MGAVNRYDPMPWHVCGPGRSIDDSVMAERPDGDWVRWEDVEPFLRTLRNHYGGQVADPDCDCDDCAFLLRLDRALGTVSR